MGRTKTSRKSTLPPPKSRLPWILGGLGFLAVVTLAAAVYNREYRLLSGHAPIVEPTGRSDAGAVLDPLRFTAPRQREAYAAAREIPAVLNQLYCWCGCKKHSVHRSLLECFESEHGANCDICTGEAVLALAMVRKGVTDIRAIQDAIDASWAHGRRNT